MLVMTIFSAYTILLSMICRLLLRFVLRKSKLFVKLTLLRWHQIESNPKLELYTHRPMCFLEKVWIWPIIFVVYCHPADIQRYLWSAIRLMVCQPKFLQDVWNIFRVNILFQKKFLWATESDTILNFFFNSNLWFLLIFQVADVTFAHFHALQDCHLIVLVLNSNDTKSCCAKLVEVIANPKFVPVFSLQRGVRNSATCKDE